MKSLTFSGKRSSPHQTPETSCQLIASSLSVTLGGRQILHNVDLLAQPGTLTALVGPNGAGKSTLLAALAGDYPASAGFVQVGSHRLSDLGIGQLARYRAVLTQHQQLTVPFTAREVMSFGRSPWGYEDEDLCDAIIDECDVEYLLDRIVPTLSGGERARVHCARVFYQNTPVVLLDEPTAALDLRHAEKIMTMARSQAEKGKTIVVVLHDLSLAAAYCDQVVIMDKGRAVAEGTPENTLDEETVSRVYGIDVEVLRDSAGNLVLIPRRT